jgi:hypothetical protein
MDLSSMVRVREARLSPEIAVGEFGFACAVLPSALRRRTGNCARSRAFETLHYALNRRWRCGPDIGAGKRRPA